MEDLSLIPKAELVEELKRRCDTCFFAMTTNVKTEEGYIQFASKGEALQLKGLVYMADMKIGGQLAFILNQKMEGE